jgi:hypothetical protein
MRALLHLLLSGFATIEMEERIEVRTQAEPRARKQFRFVMSRLEALKRPFWTLFISGIDPV